MFKKGYVMTEEHKRKIRIAHLGKKSGMQDKHHSQETKNKISEHHKKVHYIPNPKYWFKKGQTCYWKSKKIDRIKYPKMGHFKKHSEETKRKISKAHKGKTTAWMGRHHSEETKIKIAEANRGKNSGMYKHGLSNDKNYINWLKNKRNRLRRRLESAHTFGEWENLKAQFNWVCPCCCKKEPEIKLTEDHIIPLSKGGSDNIENIQPLCQKCNSKKNTKIISFVENFNNPNKK